MAKYRFQFETGNICDGPIEVKVRDFIGEVKGEEINASLALTIEAQGGQLITDEPVKSKAKRKARPVKWPDKEGAK